MVKEWEFIKTFCLEKIDDLSEEKRRKLDNAISVIEEVINAYKTNL